MGKQRTNGKVYICTAKAWRGPCLVATFVGSLTYIERRGVTVVHLKLMKHWVSTILKWKKERKGKAVRISTEVRVVHRAGSPGPALSCWCCGRQPGLLGLCPSCLEFSTPSSPLSLSSGFLPSEPLGSKLLHNRGTAQVETFGICHSYKPNSFPLWVEK